MQDELVAKLAAEGFDELEELGYVRREPDPADRREKLVCPTDRGLAQTRAAGRIMAALQDSHARRLGQEIYPCSDPPLIDVTNHQRRRATS